jgi:5-methyltetrahydropteroyltriglutamate--homocysteine methyltransferase
MTNHFRAEQVGSLLRPPELLEARAARAEGRLTLDELHRMEDQAILATLEKQREIGIEVYTDGEMRRGSWLTDMADAVDGFVSQKVVFEWRGPNGADEASTAQAVGGKLRKRSKLTAGELPFLKKNAPGPFKITVPAPSNFLMASYKPGLTDEFYPTHADLLRCAISPRLSATKFAGWSPKVWNTSSSMRPTTRTSWTPGSARRLEPPASMLIASSRPRSARITMH